MIKFKNMDGPEWWRNFSTPEEAEASLVFPDFFFEGRGKPYRNTREELAAHKYNAKKFGLDLTGSIERLERIIAGTQEAYEQAERKRAAQRARETINRLKAEGKWSYGD